MATDQEIEATLKRAKEIDDQIAQLVRQAQDRNLDDLFASADKEFERFSGVLKAENPPAGTGPACFDAAITLIADWSEVEVAALEGMHEADGGKSPGSAKTAPARAGQRRGMRI
jgi:hypothetical protein